MAPKSEAYGNKRKLVDRSKDHSSKKPKFDKRQPQREEPEDESDSSDFSDLDDGGAPLNDTKLQKNESKNGDNQAGKVFEKGSSR